MNFPETITEILSKAKIALTPQEIREHIKNEFPQFYATESHKLNVEKGYYQHPDHALLAQVYTVIRRSDRFVCDNSVRPMKVSLAEPSNEEQETFSIEDLEKNTGTIYVLKTDTFTKDKKEIIKIGITTSDINLRIKQLYTTGVPFKFSLFKSYHVAGFTDLEKALHSLLAKFRLNSAREFFTADAIPFVERIVALHKEINKECLPS